MKNGPLETWAFRSVALGYLLIFVSFAAASGHLLIAIGVEVGAAWLVYVLVRHYRRYAIPVRDAPVAPDSKPSLLYACHYMLGALLFISPILTTLANTIDMGKEEYMIFCISFLFFLIGLFLYVIAWILPRRPHA